jgi:16S rRNA C967 or C1407 C5-methylase (RsmB/RsmF family)
VLYSVCTWTRAETDGVVDAALARHPELELVPLAGPGAPEQAAVSDPSGASDPSATSESAAAGTRRRFWPHRHGSDGIFLARLRKIR